jgi:hypothetical protein
MGDGVNPFPHADASAYVFGMCDYFQMVWVRAGTVAAQVVDVHIVGNVPTQVLHIGAMDTHYLAAPAHVSVTTTTESAGPNPAAIWVGLV